MICSRYFGIIQVIETAGRGASTPTGPMPEQEAQLN